MAGDNPEMENQRIQWKLTKRKQQINQILSKKRNLPTIPIDPLQQHNAEEDEEIKVEDPPISNGKISIRNGEGAGDKGHQVRTSKKQKNHHSKKKCWYCRSPSTSKIIAHSSVVTTAKEQDISKPTVEKEKWMAY